MSAFEWFSIVQTAVMAIATGFLYTIKRRTDTAVSDARLHDKVQMLEEEMKRSRDWKHDVLIPWMQDLFVKLDDRYLMRRDQHDTPWPPSRDRRKS